MTYIYLWEYRVRPDAVEAFLGHYRPDGSWAALFGRGAGYLGTELLCDRDDPRRFMTLDRWRSRDDHAAFVAAHREEFDALDRRCERLTESERLIGEFALVPDAGPD